MDSNNSNEKEIKTNGDAQITVVEMKDIIHCTSSSEENKKSGYEIIFSYNFAWLAKIKKVLDIIAFW